ILIDYFLKGERIVLSNFKTAAGVFEQDKYLAMIQGVVNLIISIVLVRKIGLVGVYIGTIVSGLIANLTKPVIIYKACFDRSAKAYYMDSLKYLPVIGVITAICYPIHQFVMAGVSIGRFWVAGILVTIVFHVVFLLCFYRTREMQYILEVFRRKFKKE
ncbi:MAG: polysaccharide biosynthesis protein, partial [Clostridiales bacterium]|nr:polysaccharide biosynthesis protein [Clostridiales bacterium]